MACSSPVEQIPYGNEVLSKLEIKEFEGRPKNIILLIGDGGWAKSNYSFKDGYIGS